MSAALPRFTWDQPRVASIQVEAGAVFEQRHLEHLAAGIKSAPVDEETRAKLAEHFANHVGPTKAVPPRLLTPPRKSMKQLRMTEALTWNRASSVRPQNEGAASPPANDVLIRSTMSRSLHGAYRKRKCVPRRYAGRPQPQAPAASNSSLVMASCVMSSLPDKGFAH